MSRKHYNALAAALAVAKPNGNLRSPEAIQWFTDIAVIAKVYKSFNPAFDTERFVDACLKQSGH